MLQCNSICLVKVFLEKYTAFSAKFLFFLGKLNEILQKKFLNECKNLFVLFSVFIQPLTKINH
jgi:hypothetical protein